MLESTQVTSRQPLSNLVPEFSRGDRRGIELHSGYGLSCIRFDKQRKCGFRSLRYPHPTGDLFAVVDIRGSQQIQMGSGCWGRENRDLQLERTDQ